MDEMGDIIWFNDVVDCQQLSSPAAATSAAYITTTTTSSSSTAAPAPSEDVTSRNSNTNSEDVFNELASILLSCESYDILTATGATNDPGLQFSTYAGHQIEFKVWINLLQPFSTILIQFFFYFRLSRSLRVTKWLSPATVSIASPANEWKRVRLLVRRVPSP